MGDIKNGSETVKLIQKVKNWYDSHMPESLKIYTELDHANSRFMDGLSKLDRLHETQRQKSYSEQASNHPDVLRYAIHLHICRTEKKRIYIYRNIRIVFANRIADAREKFKVICEGPKEPVYVPL